MCSPPLIIRVVTADGREVIFGVPDGAGQGVAVSVRAALLLLLLLLRPRRNKPKARRCRLGRRFLCGGLPLHFAVTAAGTDPAKHVANWPIEVKVMNEKLGGEFAFTKVTH